MFNSVVLDVAIGLIFVFVLVSSLCSAIREGIEAWLKTRASYLEYSIRQLLRDPDGLTITKDFFQHPLIRALYRGDYPTAPQAKEPGPWRSGRGLPSYIPARTFVLALLDLAARGPVEPAHKSDSAAGTTSETGVSGSTGVTFESLRQGIRTLDNPPLERALQAALDAAAGDLNRARKYLEAWYDDAMERASGWYRRSTQWVLLGIAIVVVCTLNINAIRIAEHLYHDPAARSLAVASVSNPDERTYEQAKADLEALNLPLGWGQGWNWYRAEGRAPRGFDPWSDLIAPVLGLLITATAALFGAPFWFDLANRLGNLRSTRKQIEEPSRSPSPHESAFPPSMLVASSSDGEATAAAVQGEVLDGLP